MLEIRKKPRESQTAYDDIYTHEGIRQRESFYRWILRVLAPQPGRRLLDVACGAGDLSNLAAQAGVAAYGVDFSAAALHVAKERGGGHFVVADGEALPFADSQFDYVTSIGSLEHYADMAQGAREIARVLAPDGLAFILLPNSFSILHNVWTALRTGRTEQDDQPIQRYAARYEWQDLLEQNGLRTERTVKYEREWPVTWADRWWYLGHPKPLIRLLLTPLVPLNWASCFVYLCRQR
ncbi:MAG: class I SAM-dependent methyltransferase [Chloroflexi bacterium]|nr:class I SAM-dependent methyltransferase [Chloroflexota bacterium]